MPLRWKADAKVRRYQWQDTAVSVVKPSGPMSICVNFTSRLQPPGKVKQFKGSWCKRTQAVRWGSQLGESRQPKVQWPEALRPVGQGRQWIGGLITMLPWLDGDTSVRDNPNVVAAFRGRSGKG